MGFTLHSLDGGLHNVEMNGLFSFKYLTNVSPCIT